MSPLLPILAFGFVAPWLFAAGAAATSIPIIIHLLNKRKFRIVIWAAMDFLLAAQRRNARRLKFQRWLLLALRCLALLIIAAGIAQFSLTSCSAVTSALGGQRVVVLIWDDSYSLGFTPNPGSPSSFDRSKKLASEWLASVKPGDKVMVVRASTVGLLASAGNKPTLDAKGVKSQIDAAQITDAGTDLAGAIEQTTETFKDLEKSTRTRQVVILTDLSRSSVQPNTRAGSAADAERLKKSIDELKKLATTVRVVDVGTADQNNSGVSDIRPRRPVVVAGILNEFDITVTNGTDRPLIDHPLTIYLDGVQVHQEKLGKIDAGTSRTVLVSINVPTAGRHYIEAKIPGDYVTIDDTRRLMVNVQREVPVLLVDGSPPDNRTLGSTTYLWVAFGLSADGKAASVFAPKIITEIELATTPLSQYPAVVLSDIATPGPATRDQLQKYVEDGGLLLIFPGARTNAQGMNETLGDAGAKILPATFGQPVVLRKPDQSPDSTLFADDFSHPVLAKFGEAYKEGLKVGFTTVQTSKYLNLGIPKDGSSEIILRYASRDGAPSDVAVVTKPVGKGRVVQFASSADTTWNTFGAKPSFVPFIHELAYYALPREAEGLTLRLGEKISLPADAASPGSWSAPRNQTISVSTVVGPDGQARLSSNPLTSAGLYGPATGATAPVIAINPDASEIDIRHVSPASFAASTGLDPSEILQGAKAIEVNAGTDAKTGGAEIGRWLILIALAFFVGETILARFFSVYK